MMKSLPKKNLRIEIITILLIKIIVLAVIWWMFFKDQHAVVDSRAIKNQILFKTTYTPKWRVL